MCVMALLCLKGYCSAATVYCFKLLQLPSEHKNQARPPQEENSTEWYLMARMALDRVRGKKKNLIPKGPQSSKSSDLGKWSLDSSWTSVFNQEKSSQEEVVSSSQILEILLPWNAF